MASSKRTAHLITLCILLSIVLPTTAFRISLPKLNFGSPSKKPPFKPAPEGHTKPEESGGDERPDLPDSPDTPNNAVPTTTSFAYPTTIVAYGDSYADACATLYYVCSLCNYYTADWFGYDRAVQAECACYSNYYWVTEVFDNAAASCLTYLSTAGDAYDYTVVAEAAGMCSSAGNVLHLTPAAAGQYVEAATGYYTGAVATGAATSVAVTRAGSTAANTAVATGVSGSGARNVQFPVRVSALSMSRFY
jgi:hypothetical protein